MATLGTYTVAVQEAPCGTSTRYLDALQNLRKNSFGRWPTLGTHPVAGPETPDLNAGMISRRFAKFREKSLCLGTHAKKW